MNNPPELRSLYVDPDEMKWCASEFPGIQHKVLWSDPESGRSTILFKLEPGAVVPHHEHADIEQTWVISGTFEDQEGKALPGHYIWRPAGNRHDHRRFAGRRRGNRRLPTAAGETVQVHDAACIAADANDGLAAAHFADLLTAHEKPRRAVMAGRGFLIGEPSGRLCPQSG